MKNTINNPESLKLGTIIKTKFANFKLIKRYKTSLLVEVEGKVERDNIHFDMFRNKYFVSDIVEVVEPEVDEVPEEMPDWFSIGVEAGVIDVF